MPGHAHAIQMFGNNTQKDPGASGSISVYKNPFYMDLVSAAAETRTLKRPTRQGAYATLCFKTDGGTITLTVTGGYNANGDTTITFDEAGQSVTFVSIKVGTTLRWQLIAGDAAGGGVQAAEAMTALGTLTAADSGKTIFLNAAAGFAVTLPAPALGLRFKFVVMAAPSGGSYTVVTAGSPDQILSGRVITSQDAGGSGDSEDAGTGTTITFVDGQAVVGDTAVVECDGTSYHSLCFAKVVAGITITG
jgi:hypothetical protein